MKFKYQILFILMLLVVTNAAFAQTPPPGGGSSVGAPIDAFSGILLLVGAAFAGKRIANNEESNL